MGRSGSLRSPFGLHLSQSIRRTRLDTTGWRMSAYRPTRVPPKCGRSTCPLARICHPSGNSRPRKLSRHSLANNAGIELSQLYKWNTVLGVNGENCSTQIWPGYYYCVGTATRTTSQPPTSTVVAALPTQTQQGFPTNCKMWMATKSGDTCWSIGNDNGIALEVLYALNPVLGANGENCGTQVWPEYSYCLAV